MIPEGIETAADRFWSKVAKGEPHECWPWIASRNPDGYGQLGFKNRNVRAHRFSVWLSGREIPEGMVVDHTCRNRACVNPNHLRVVTNHQNLRENSVAAAAMNGDKTHCLHGHLLSGDNVVIDDGYRRCRACDNRRNQEYYARKGDEIRAKRQAKRDALRQRRSVETEGFGPKDDSPSDAQP